MKATSKIILTVIFVHFLISILAGEERILGKVVLHETAGLARQMEYVEFPLQVTMQDSANQEIGMIAMDRASGEKIYCQTIPEHKFPAKHTMVTRVVFPVAVAAHAVRTFSLIEDKAATHQPTDLRMEGEGLELKIENEYYLADLTKKADPEPKTHSSGQIRELLIKLGFNQLLTNAEDRVHWAPNFKREELEYYTTIAHWENPREYHVASGNYLIRTERRDAAPDHPEIMLTAVYNFYSDVPYFKFYSEMDFIQDLPLELLRNDEMTTDSIFTHLAFQRPDGKTVDVRFKDRYDLLRNQPIENDAPWICFYNIERGFAFGSIRLRYDNHNRSGELSPTYLPRTQIGEWLDRKYWNRRLINDHLTCVPKGSRYLEENAYLVFKIGKADRFEKIRYWAERLRQPVKVEVIPAENE